MLLLRRFPKGNLLPRKGPVHMPKTAARADPHPKRLLDMHSEIARDHNHNDDYADDVENIHGLAPI
jgi:hypothetical protein